MTGMPLRWLAKNIGTLLTAFVLAVIVWVSAVVASDPNEENVLARPVPVEIVGQDPGLQVMNEVASEVTLTLNAPSSVWTVLNSDPQAVRAWIDLSNLGSGEHEVPVQIQISPRLVRLVRQDPETMSVSLENIITQVFPVKVQVRGTPPTGYQAQTPVVDPFEVTLVGPESLVDRVQEVRVSLDISGTSDTITRAMTPTAVDADGRVVSGVTINPATVTVTQPITLLGGFRYVIVRAVSIGQVANGYRLTNIFVSPVGVVAFSADPQLVNDLPGYIETEPLDLSGADNDFEALISLALPDGVSVVGDSKVLVQVSIAAIETSLAISFPVEVIGLTPGLSATVAPMTMDVILSGPVPILDDLEPGDVRVVIDLTGYDIGVYQLIPVVEILPEQVQRISMLPATIEVTIIELPILTVTPTATLAPGVTPVP
jgi:YbbR domain-containing protein